MPISTNIRKQAFETSVGSVLNYGGQTWSMNKRNLNKLRNCQRSMERSLLNVSLNDRVRSETIREQTQFCDLEEKAKKLKWEWAGHVYRMSDNRWTKLSTEWTPWDGKRRQGGQLKRWRDDIKYCCPQYHAVARNRTEWTEKGKEFIRST